MTFTEELENTVFKLCLYSCYFQILYLKVNICITLVLPLILLQWAMLNKEGKNKRGCLGMVRLKNDVISLLPNTFPQFILRPAVRSAESVFSEVHWGFRTIIMTKLDGGMFWSFWIFRKLQVWMAWPSCNSHRACAGKSGFLLLEQTQLLS